MELNSMVGPPTATTGAHNNHQSGAAVAPTFVERRKELELQLATAKRDAGLHTKELQEQEKASKQMDETLQHLQYIVSAQSQEVAQQKLDLHLHDRGRLEDEEEYDPKIALTSYREVSKELQLAFRRAMNVKLSDGAYIDKLRGEPLGSKPEFCHVKWRDESADWKIFDPRDNTEVTFGALLEDVSRYWGLDQTAMTLVDLKGSVWPLDAYVWDELSASSGDRMTVEVVRNPRVKALGRLELEYTVDETTLPIAVQRRLNRERRAAQLARHTKESLRRERQRERNALFSEFLKYLFMMALYFSVLLLRRDVRASFLVLDALTECFVGENFGDFNEKSYMDIATYEEFYEWAQGPFTEGLLPAERYDGSEIPKEEKRIMNYNRAVGGLRLRQARVTPNAGCIIYSNVQDKFTPTEGPDANKVRKRKYVDKCYSPYRGVNVNEGQRTWSRRPFGPMAQNPTNSSGPLQCRDLHGSDFSDAERSDYDSYAKCLGLAEWNLNALVNPDSGLTYEESGTNLTDPKRLAFTWRDGILNGLPPPFRRNLKYSSYDGSGFVYDLTNLTTSNLVEAFQYLRDEVWLDRETRAIFMSLFVYNPNYNMYAVLNFELELSLAGVLVPRYNLQAAKMDLYFGMLDSMAETMFVVVEGILYLGMLGYLFNEFREVFAVYNDTGSIRGYVTDTWNIIDWSLIIVSIFACGMRVQFILMPQVREFTPFTQEFPELSAAVELYNSSFSLDAIAAFFGIFKIFRFFDLQRNLLVLRRSVARGVGDLAIFTFILLTMLFGFALAAMNIFGQESDVYLDPFEAFITLFLMVLGEFDFVELQRINPIFAYLFFILYQFFVFLIMVNVFLAILNDAYIAIVDEFESMPDLNEGGPRPTIRQRLGKLRAWLRQRQLDGRIEALRKKQRKEELIAKRETRKIEMARAKTLKALGMAASGVEAANAQRAPGSRDATGGRASPTPATGGS